MGLVRGRFRVDPQICPSWPDFQIFSAKSLGTYIYDYIFRSLFYCDFVVRLGANLKKSIHRPESVQNLAKLATFGFFKTLFPRFEHFKATGKSQINLESWGDRKIWTFKT